MPEHKLQQMQTLVQIWVSQLVTHFVVRVHIVERPTPIHEELQQLLDDPLVDQELYLHYPKRDECLEHVEVLLKPAPVPLCVDKHVHAEHPHEPHDGCHGLVDEFVGNVAGVSGAGDRDHVGDLLVK
jgi:hypothetical protein